MLEHSCVWAEALFCIAVFDVNQPTRHRLKSLSSGVRPLLLTLALILILILGSICAAVARLFSAFVFFR